MEVTTLAGGCFWCLEAVFDNLQGVASVESGYMGGTVVDPTYEQVCGGNTGHAEVVQVTFDPNVVAFEDVLKIFFVIHDPTTLNRQGNDLGTQYRSAIYYHSPEQKAGAERVITDLTREALFKDRIVTEVAPGLQVLSGRGRSPGVLRAEPEPGLLSVRRRAESRQVPQVFLRAPEKAGLNRRFSARACGQRRSPLPDARL